MRVIAIVGALALLAGCGVGNRPETTPATVEACADGGARLAGTGLCQSEASALVPADPDVRTPELEGCTWSVNETMLPADEALLYRAATCNGVTTQLGFAGGARSAEIAYERSAQFGDAAIGRVVVRLYGTDPDPQGALKAAIAEAPASERASCEIAPAGGEGWPADALIIAPNAAALARLPKDKPVIACGPLGVDQTKVRYWRVRQGFAWFFDLGDRDPDFDAGNMTLVARAADGAWAVKP
ncbi:MAG: hypothetical protein NW200_15145 [Hyphomonadaceae bacterium]|nr:hypothetical protein [Hyphomonadaceae bacterium]